MSEIKAYVDQFEQEKREWILEFTQYMHDKHPEMKPTIWFRMPTYKKDNVYIAFSVAKQHFTVHTNDEQSFQLMKEALPDCKVGKRSIQIKYDQLDAKRVIYNTIEFLARKTDFNKK
ncbi:MAG: hypothetical protein PUC65_17265 [Clostridiales bacterium]|nr:hypothetical protein [Clostridiales bacterium]